MLRREPFLLPRVMRDMRRREPPLPVSLLADSSLPFPFHCWSVLTFLVQQPSLWRVSLPVMPCFRFTVGLFLLPFSRFTVGHAPSPVSLLAIPPSQGRLILTMWNIPDSWDVRNVQH